MDPTTDRRTFWLNRLREQWEHPDTPQQVKLRSTIVVRVRRLAIAAGDQGERAEAMGALVLLEQWDARRADHVAIAISAHTLYLKAVQADLSCIGQTVPEWVQILTLLCDYLDSCGWGYEDGWFNRNDPQQLHTNVDMLIEPTSN